MKNFKSVLKKIEAFPIGMPIPKPHSSGNTKILNWGTRRGRPALVYQMPNHKNPTKPHQKGVTIEELNQAYDQLQLTGEFSHTWFAENMSACNKEGGCNYTTIGGLFVLVGIAAYVGSGQYVTR